MRPIKPLAIVEEAVKLLLPTPATAGHYSMKETYDEDYLSVADGYFGMPYSPASAPRAGLDRAARAHRPRSVPAVRRRTPILRIFRLTPAGWFWLSATLFCLACFICLAVWAMQ